MGFIEGNVSRGAERQHVMQLFIFASPHVAPGSPRVFPPFRVLLPNSSPEPFSFVSRLSFLSLAQICC